MDIFQNSIRVRATIISLDIVEDTRENFLATDFTDNGSGMSSEISKRVTDPIFTTRTTQNIGMGLHLLNQNAEKTGVYFNIQSWKEKVPGSLHNLSLIAMVYQYLHEMITENLNEIGVRLTS